MMRGEGEGRGPVRVRGEMREHAEPEMVKGSVPRVQQQIKTGAIVTPYNVVLIETISLIT